MRLIKKSEHIATCNINDSKKVIVFKYDIDLFKNDKMLYYELKKCIEPVMERYSYIIVLGCHISNVRAIGVKDKETLINNVRIGFMSGWIYGEELELLRIV